MKKGWLIIIFAYIAFNGYGQQSKRVRELELQRKEALAEIEETNKLLNETQQTAKTSLQRLNLLTSQLNTRKKVIQLLNQEVETIDKQVIEMASEITILEKKLSDKKKRYGQSVQQLYLHQTSQDKLLFILSAESFAQSLRRMRYLKEYADWQKREAEGIVKRQREITEKKSELEQTRAEKLTLLSTREKENLKLKNEEEKRKHEVQRLNTRQKELQAELRKQRKQAQALDRMIEQQIALEIARAEESRKKEEKTSSGKTDSPNRRSSATKGGYAMTKEERLLSDNFAENKGRLPYPVTGKHVIVGTFGEQQHQDLKYVRTNNSGIDIQTAAGSEARAVFNGVVTRVFVVPGYNNSIIVRHGNFLTVYSNLSEVYVKAGDKVSTRQSIGKTFTDTENNNATILHFQLWKEKTKLNPAPWLD